MAPYRCDLYCIEVGQPTGVALPSHAAFLCGYNTYTTDEAKDGVAPATVEDMSAELLNGEILCC